jgi:DHA2 family multidrug resistance protein
MTAVMASLLEIIDTSIVNVAIPTMMGNLGATLEDISWVVTGYIIANAIILPLSAWLASTFGRRRYYIGCILIFTATSVACGMAPNLKFLIIFRIIQGLAGGALLPTSQALIQEQFPRERAGTANAIFGMSVMIGPTLGPTLGGYLTDNFGWRSIFNINLPLGLATAMLASIYVTNFDPLAKATEAAKKAAQTVKKSIDVIGLGLLATGIGCLQYVLERGQADEWFDSPAIRICTFLAATSIPTLIWWELRVENPVINVRLYKHKVLRLGAMMGLELGIVLYGLIFVVPIFAERVLNYDATQTGMIFIPGALLTAACMPVVGALLRKYDPRWIIAGGITVLECALLMFATFSTSTGGSQIFWALIVRGLAMAFLFVPINTVVLGEFRGAELGQAAGLQNLFRQLGGSIGIATMSTLLDRMSAQNYADMLPHLSAVSPAAQTTLAQSRIAMAHSMLSQVGMGGSAQAALQALSFRVNNQVFVLSFEQLMWTLGISFAFAYIPLRFFKGTVSFRGPIDAH